MIRRLLIANRGEIAVRIARTCRRLGVRTVAVFSDADAHALHVAACDVAVRLGPPPARDSYLRGDLVIAAALAAGADAVHPGYGFLSENADFAQAVLDAGLIWVGPPPGAIRAMGLKDAAKTRMRAAGVPVVPGYEGADQDPALLAEQAAAIGYPVLIKARAGGGGKGMRRVDAPAAFAAALESAAREAQASFGDGAVLVEKLIASPRHIEVQVFADSHGRTIHLGERDCSLQRRHQKVIEEAPAPGVSPALRAAMGAAAVRAAQAVGYVGAGTVEFIADASEGLREDRFYFMEANTRLQVEHPVTEAVYGLDLVEWQLIVAAGGALPMGQDDLACDGWAVEARLYAEDAAAGFLPATGVLRRLRLPDGVRVDAGVAEGDAVSPHYDPMIAKLIAHGPDRIAALDRLRDALGRARIAGCVTNAAFLCRLLDDDAVRAGAVDTGLIERRGAALADDPAPLAADWALAAMAALRLSEPPLSPDPWAAQDGWRGWGAGLAVAMLANGRDAPQPVTLTAGPGGWRARTPAGEATLRAAPGRGGATRVLIDGAPTAAEACRDGLSVTVMRDGLALRFFASDPLAGADAAAQGEDVTRAPMPGAVTAVHVAPGDAVRAGDRLVTMEAMKMEHALRASRDGAVAEVHVAPGDQVAEGAPLAALAPQ